MKLKTLLAACAAMVGLSVNAQSWTSPGSDPVSGQSYYILNVGAGQFVTAANDWQTQLSATGTDTGLLIRTDQVNGVTVGGTSLSGWEFVNTNNANKLLFRNDERWGYTDKADQDKGYVWTITKVNGVYRLQTAAGDPTYPSASTQYAGANANLNGARIYFGYNSSSSDIDWMFLTEEQKSAANVVAKARLYRALMKAYAAGVNTEEASAVYENNASTAEDMAAAVTALNNACLQAHLDNASDSDPRDITEFVLNNSDFTQGNITGWETNYVSGQQATNIGYQDNNTYQSAKGYVNRFIEAWRSGNAKIGDGYLRQTVSNMPEGKYVLECDAIATNQGNTGATTTGALLYINADGVDFTTSLSTTGSAVQHFSTEFLFTGEGNVIFGLKTQNTTANWIAADNFKVTYYGIDLSAYVTQLNAAVAAFVDLEGTVPSSVYNDKKTNVLDVYNKEWGSSKEYSTAISAIQAATSELSTLASAYSEYNTIRAAVLAAYASTDVTAADNAANSASSVEDITAAIATVRTALKTAISSNKLENIDLTAALLINPSFEDAFTGWTNNGMVTQTNTSFGVDKDGNVYCEHWQPNGTFGVSQVLTAMPAGVYKLTVKAKTRGVSSGKVFAGGIEVATKIADEVNTYTVEFACDDNTDITFGFEGTGTGVEASWLALDDFHLTLVSAGLPDVTAVEGKMNAEVASAQTTAIAAYNSAKTVANYNAASAAISAAESSVAAYAIVPSAIEKANAIKDAHNFASETATTTFAEAIAAIQTGYDNGTLTNDQASAAATTLGVAVTGWHGGNNTPAAVYLRDGFALGDFAADPALHVNTWSTEGDNDGSGFSVPFYESWTADANSLPESTITGTLTNLPNGLYSVSAWVRVRAKNDVAATDATGITMDINGGGEGDYAAVDVTEGTQIGTSQFQLATYTAQGLVKKGTLTLNFNIAADTNISWLSFKNVKYTKVRDLTSEEEFVAATDDDYAALNAAMEGKVIGFEAGEYAPYNNIEAASALAAANAIDQSAQNSQEDVQAATAAISGATWTVNETEVNAFFDGSFEYDYSAQTGNVQPIGWYRNEGTYSGDGYNVRYVTIPAGVEGNTSGHGLFGKFTMQYGKEAGYTLPLKAGYYKLSFSYGGYGENGTRIVKLIGETETTISTITAKNNQGNSSADAYTAFSELVNVPADGDYVLSFYRENTTSQNQIAIADIKLYRATSEDLKQQLLAEITKANAIDITTNVGDGVFQIPTSAVSALQEGISDAQSVYENGEATSDAIITAISDLQTAEEAFANAEVNAPVSGQAYIIANTKADGALKIAAGSVTVGTNAAVFFTAVDGGYVLSNADDEYIFKTTNNTWTLSTTATEAEAYVVSVAPVDGGFTISGAKGLFGTDNTAAGSSVYANKTAANNGVWTITEAAKATMAISDAKYATFVAPFAVTIPEGVTAYTVEGVDNNVLTMTQVSTTIPANTPVVLFKEETLDATLFYGLPVEGTPEAGLLTGTYTTIPAPVDSYVLQNQEGKVGFFQVGTEDGDAKPVVRANRAYLTVPDAAGVKAFYLGDDATAIKSVFSGVAAGEIYDLSGRKVSKMQKGGVYIVGGQKVAVK